MRRKCSITPTPLLNLGGLGVHFDATYSPYWKEVKPQLKYEAIYSHRHKYSITVMCEFFGVSRSGYYCFVKRMNKPEKHQQAVEKIAERLLHI